METSVLLRATYRVNTFASLACGLALLAFGHLLAAPFAVPAGALRAMGAFFVVFAAGVYAVSRRPLLIRREAAAIGFLDAAYALGSVAAIVLFRDQMTAPLEIAIAVLAAPVAVFAAVELRAGFGGDRSAALA